MRILPLLEMGSQQIEGREGDWWTNEKHRLPLQAREHDFVHGTDAVNICGHISDREIARVYHPQIDVQSFPKFFRAVRTLFIARLALLEGPRVPHVDCMNVFEAILLRAAHTRLEPG